MIDQISPQILIVDDHPSVRAGVRRAIEGAGMRCCGEAASRDEAVAQIALHNPDGLVLDLNLPDGSGLDVISWIRELSQTMAILMLTISDEDSHLLAAMKSGASAYVKNSEVSMAPKKVLESSGFVTLIVFLDKTRMRNTLISKSSYCN